MSDQRPDLENLPPGFAYRNLPATQAKNAQPIAHSDLASLRYRSAEDLNLRGLWRIVRKRLWMILGIVFIVGTLTTLTVFRAKPLYQATVTIEISRDSGARASTTEVFIRQEDALFVTMNTSEVIIKSAPLLEDVVVRLKLDENPAFLDRQGKETFMESLRGIAGRIQSDGTPEAPAVFVSTPAPVLARITGSRSEEEVGRLAPYVRILEGSLRVKPILDTRAMTISFTHTDAGIAAGVANAVAGRFVETSFDRKVEGFTSASEWLDRSTRELKAKVERSEQALADYTQKNNIYSIDGKETLITEKLARLHDQATRAETDRILKESLYEQVRQGRIAQVPEAFANPQTAELQKKLGELAIIAAELSVTYGPKYSRMAEINEQMASVRGQIADSRTLLDGKLRADYERAVRDEQAMNTALDQAKVEATRENQSAIQYSLIKQDVDTSKSLYTQFLQKTNQAYLEVAQQNSNIRVIAPARVPTYPVNANRMRSMLIGLLMSLAGGIGLAWLLERFDDSIRNIDDVNRVTQLPTLALIPAIGSVRSSRGRRRREIASGTVAQPAAPNLSAQMRRARLMEFDGRSPVAEAFRALRTGLLLSAAGSPPKTILVTSVRMGEGKTTTAANVAISLAQLGASVLLIDCDLRKPSAHEAFGIPQSPGLSTFLSRNGEIGEVVHDMAVEHLRLIPAGPTPPNPAELLSSEKMKRMLEQVAESYDHVVIDSPPMGSVTDAAILSTMVDGVILVVHGRRNSRQAVHRACHELTTVGARIFGIVLNHVDLRREGYDDSYYSYGYATHGSRSKT